MEGSNKVGHIYNEDLGTKLSKNPHEDEIIKGIRELSRDPAGDKRVSYNVLMSYLVEEQHVMGKGTFDKYRESMVEERKLIRTEDTESNKVFYRVAPEFWKYTLPSDEEELRKAINQMNEFMPKFEKDFPKITLLDKVLVSGDFYQNLRRICTWHEMIFLRETTTRPDKAELNAEYSLPLSFNAESFLSLRAELNGLTGKLFTVIGNDADGKTIQYLLQLKILLPEERLDISFIKKYNRYVANLEKKLKNNDHQYYSQALTVNH